MPAAAATVLAAVLAAETADGADVAGAIEAENDDDEPARGGRGATEDADADAAEEDDGCDESWR
jgi:hypothetical protein